MTYTNSEDFSYEEYLGVCIETIKFSRATLNETDVFRKRIEENIKNGKKDIIVDLSFCDYCDSSFIGALVVCAKKTGLKNGKFGIVITEGSEMSALIQTTRLDKILSIYKTRDEALLYFTNQNSSNN